jgi:hypothetical protein
MDIALGKKLNYLSETKSLIKAALIEKGQAVSDTDTFRSYADKVLAIETGGGSGGGGALGTCDYLVQVVDYDGTVLSIGYMNKGDVFTLPDAPTHEGLVFDGWSSPVTITDNTVTVTNQDITIGAMYHTESGATELDLVLTEKTGLTFTFRGAAYINGMTSVDWGDGKTDSTLTHTYSGYGKYTIKIYGATQLKGGSYGGTITNATTDLSIVAVRLASSVTTLAESAFYNAFSLTSIAIPSSVTSFGERTFFSCNFLKHVTIPIGVTSIPENAFRECYRIVSVAVPSGVTSFAGSAFFYCYNLRNISIPIGVTSLGSKVFRGCTSLTSATIPSGVTSLPSSGFQDATTIKRITILTQTLNFPSYIFTGCMCRDVVDLTAYTVVPTLYDVNAFGTAYYGLKILVPASLYDEWIAAQYWVNLKPYFVPV